MYKTIETLFTKGMAVERPKAYTKQDAAKFDYTKDALSKALSPVTEEEFAKNDSLMESSGAYYTAEDTTETFIRIVKTPEKEDTKVILFVKNSEEDKEASGVDNYNITVYPNRRDDYCIKVTACDEQGQKISKEKLTMDCGQLVSMTNPVQGEGQTK